MPCPLTLHFFHSPTVRENDTVSRGKLSSKWTWSGISIVK